MKKILFLLLFTITFSFSQTNNEFKLLKKINGVEIYVKIKKLKDTKSKTDWLIEFEYTNATNTDLFYKSYFTKENPDLLDIIADKEAKTKEKEETSFCKINVENKNGFWNSNANGGITGDKTRLKTDKNETILLLKKNKTYTRSFEMRTNLDEEPIINISIINSISFTEQINDFL